MKNERNYNPTPLQYPTNEWLEKERKKLEERVQKAIDEDFARTHDLIMKNLVPKEKDKGTIRNINNYRMKLWSEVLVAALNLGFTDPKPTGIADTALQEFDKRFNI